MRNELHQISSETVICTLPISWWFRTGGLPTENISGYHCSLERICSQAPLEMAFSTSTIRWRREEGQAGMEETSPRSLLLIHWIRLTQKTGPLHQTSSTAREVRVTTTASLRSHSQRTVQRFECEFFPIESDIEHLVELSGQV